MNLRFHIPKTRNIYFGRQSLHDDKLGTYLLYNFYPAAGCCPRIQVIAGIGCIILIPNDFNLRYFEVSIQNLGMNMIIELYCCYDLFRHML